MASIPAPSASATAGVDEKTPLLIVTSEDVGANITVASTKHVAASTTTETTAAATTTATTATATRTTSRPVRSENHNPYLQQKVEEIELLLSQPEIDLWKLREFALSPGGLVSDAIRKRAWPKLVGLDHKYDPLPLDDVIAGRKNDSSSSGQGTSVPCSPSQSSAVPTIEIDAQHELFKNKNDERNSAHSREFPPSSSLIVESMDTAQIDRDVARCTWHLLTGSQRSRRSQQISIKKNSTRGNACQRTCLKADGSGLHRAQSYRHSAKYRRNRKVTVLLKKKQNRLANLINLTLVQSYDRSDVKNMDLPSPNRLRYYQGYHDVACIFLHALGGSASNQTPLDNNEGNGADFPSHRVYRHYHSGDLELPSKVLCQVSFSHFSDALRSDFLRLQTGLKLVLFPLLSKIDREVHDHLLDADMEPFFCLSWILTWFAHDVRDTSLVKRLFDAFLVGHPALPIYATLSMMTHPYNRQMIMETDCDFAALHQCLASLPKHSCKVGYKERVVDGFNNVVTYVSDDEGEPAADDNFTIVSNTASYLEEEESEFDDNDSHTFDTRSHYTNDTIFTESSFPTSVNSTSQISSNGMLNANRKTASIANTGGSLASGSLASLQNDGGCEPLSFPTDRTMISTEAPDFLSNESTLVSGNWNEAWRSDVKDDTGVGVTSTSSAGGNVDKKKVDLFVIDDHNPVPFESVLDNALQLIKTYPPSSLVALAKAYFQEDWESQLSLLSTSTQGEQDNIDVQELIGLLQPNPPPWSILPSCNSDWIDKQKQRQDLGLKPTSRKDRRRRKQKNSSPVKSNRKQAEMGLDSSITIRDKTKAVEKADEDKTVDPMDYVRSNPEDLVVAAIGYGPGLEAKIRERKLLRERRRRRKRQRAVLIGCSVVVIGALVMYGGPKMIGKTITPDSPEDLDDPAPHVRQLRADPKSDDNMRGTKSEESTSIRKAANVGLPRPNTTTRAPQREQFSSQPPSFESKSVAIPASPIPPNIASSSLSAVTLPSTHVKPSIFTSHTALLPTSLPARASHSVVSIDPNRRNQNPSRPANESPLILKGMVDKTKRFFTRFAHHLW
eukprot:CAMPEP_0197198752 /NCGR_PEP_ID=MMETSP1423-20130617/33532_1 /TAXON_ID=476441 /ORGANISM="Pseudo-nitzschia heimii, Strain UNC1101" /LENGTH=1067 /DNA_ID=CAMNT_0042652589 /DNA_START=190 /DNA_END=3390 /DNA_ORIENTATION=+